jgi:hypothetical protein
LLYLEIFLGGWARLQFLQHPLEQGQIFQSFGGHFTYRVIGPCCRLFDREELPWPCCRIQWRTKEPSWRRIGKRFVPDIATKNSPSYCVEVLGQESSGKTFVVTLYAVKLAQPLKEWWHTQHLQEATNLPPLPVSTSALK